MQYSAVPGLTADAVLGVWAQEQFSTFMALRAGAGQTLI